MSSTEKPNSRHARDGRAALAEPPPGSRVSRALVLAYGILVYVGFLAIFVYLVGFLMRIGVPKTIDDGVSGSGAVGVALNLAILAVFAAQHTVMARPAFKRWFTRFVPAAAERSTFVLLTNIILTWLVVAWRPFPGVIWELEGMAATLVTGIALVGWAIVLVSTFLTDHWELLGLKQTFAYGLGRPLQTTRFRERSLYRHVRHPMMLGFIIAFWAAPTLTFGHLLFASVATAYILVALSIEERTLVELHGGEYEDYRRRVPRIIPRLRGATSPASGEDLS